MILLSITCMARLYLHKRPHHRRTQSRPLQTRFIAIWHALLTCLERCLPGRDDLFETLRRRCRRFFHSDKRRIKQAQARTLPQISSSALPRNGQIPITHQTRSPSIFHSCHYKSEPRCRSEDVHHPQRLRRGNNHTQGLRFLTHPIRATSDGHGNNINCQALSIRISIRITRKEGLGRSLSQA